MYKFLLIIGTLIFALTYLSGYIDYKRGKINKTAYDRQTRLVLVLIFASFLLMVLIRSKTLI